MGETTTYAVVVQANVKHYRVQAGVSQSELAQRMQVLGFDWYPSTANRTEHGQRLPAVAELIGLALSLGVDTPMLLDPAILGAETTISLGEVPELPHSYARALVRADVEASVRATDLLTWRRQAGGEHVPFGPLTGAYAVAPTEALGFVRLSLIKQGLDGAELEAKLTEIQGILEAPGSSVVFRGDVPKGGD